MTLARQKTKKNIFFLTLVVRVAILPSAFDVPVSLIVGDGDFLWWFKSIDYVSHLCV